MTWEEACEDSSLDDLPFKIELNGEGNLVMSQIWVAHGADQAEIGFQLAELMPHGQVSMETGVMTGDNVKVADGYGAASPSLRPWDLTFQHRDGDTAPYPQEKGKNRFTPPPN